MNTVRCRTCAGVAAVFCAAILSIVEAAGQWPQWGGPHRSFVADASGLADSWPDDGPRLLWKRELGDGYSSVIVDEGVLYATYRKVRNEPRECTAALNANTGETLWEREVDSPLTDGETQFGDGPNSTPLIHGDCLYSVGANALVQCFDKRTGAVKWKYDLVAEHQALIGGWGYSASPVAYKDKIIVAIDHDNPEGQDGRSEGEPPAKEVRRGPTLVALDARTGKSEWTSLECKMDHASPIVITFNGRDQLVVLTSCGVAGVDPATGELLWRHDLDHAARPTPLFDGKDTLFFFCGGMGRAIQLYDKDGRTRTRELWRNKKLRFGQPTPVLVDGMLIGSVGGNGPGLLLCADVKTGKRLWARRGFTMSNCVAADGKLIVLDDQGTLGLVDASPTGMEILSTFKIMDTPEVYATPAIVGDKLYARDRRHVAAYDLGIEANGK